MASAVRGMTSSQLLRAFLTVISPNVLEALPDPGEPNPVDVSYRQVTLKNGRTRRVRVVPQLRVRYPVRLEHATVRKAAWAAATIGSADGARLITSGELAAVETEMCRCRLRLEQLSSALETLAFRPLQQPIHKPWQATYVMGFTHEWGLDPQTVNSRFRTLAPIYHPDTGLLSSAERMSQLVEARNFLLRHLRR
ncbi:hypothetical protein [Azospirillum sp. B510]|uniref:hypothetical protein n=1 Tax=Alphaproteobacteria TaxID=28211 RepID=UPI000348B562|nr:MULTISPECIES: hypothetical protein [Alphaproteobacteria]